jgi:predicted MPP superfamily phosphohydrolase
MENVPHYRELEERLGRVYLRQRLGVQKDHVARIFGGGRTFFHIENWYSIHGVLRACLRCSGLYRRGRRNALRVAIEHNEVDLPHLPEAFNAYSLLQLSDLHIDLNPALADALIERLDEVSYDACVITGDFRGATFGPYEETLALTARIREHIKGPVYAVLGNHDCIEMVPRFEDMGIRMLLNEAVALERGGSEVHLVGVDDPHTYETDNVEKAMSGVPEEGVSILLAHSPEVYKLAAHAGIDLMLCGHTHGGQICLPRGRPVLRNARCPRRLGRGAWRHHGLQGYTARGTGCVVMDVRLNCLPEITLHHLRVAPGTV